MTLKYKLVMLGDTSVGKSSIIKKFAYNSFYEFEEPTIGAAFICKDIEVDNEKIRLEIWDTAGQERYKSLTPMYFRYANIAIIVFDLTNKDSFEGVKYWMQTLEEKGEPDIFKVLVGNKKDIRNKIQVTTILSGVSSPYDINLENEVDEISEIVEKINEDDGAPKITSIWE